MNDMNPIPPEQGSVKQPGSAGHLSEIKAERLQLDGQVYDLQAHVLRDLEPGRGKVQDGFDSRRDEPVRDGLGGLRRDGDDPDLQIPPLGLRGEFPQGEDRHALDRKSTRLNSSHIQKSRMPSSA